MEEAERYSVTFYIKNNHIHKKNTNLQHPLQIDDHFISFPVH